MRLFVQATLSYRFATATEVLLQIEAARSADQLIAEERLSLSCQQDLRRVNDEATGDRRLVFVGDGDVEITYSALADVHPRAAALDEPALTPVRDLPPDAIRYLLPSRYCPSDRFEDFVAEEFGAVSGGAKVAAILKWLAEHLEYRVGASDANSTAADTFECRAGVCRDFTHLAITFCRAAQIPARAVSAYAWKLDPPDMHAVVEVYLGGRWQMIDPTGLAPVDGLVRVATGLDATDIAFMTIFGEAELLAQTFSVFRLDDATRQQ